ncbi:hypothetical protein BC829DRAFT_449318 [Chytridium lagenaria]|nr:hypothetical protein BC829DRAFT_449318 [Chytridium lagenaria]
MTAIHPPTPFTPPTITHPPSSILTQPHLLIFSPILSSHTMALPSSPILTEPHSSRSPSSHPRSILIHPIRSVMPPPIIRLEFQVLSPASLINPSHPLPHMQQQPSCHHWNVGLWGFESLSWPFVFLDMTRKDRGPITTTLVYGVQFPLMTILIATRVWSKLEDRAPGQPSRRYAGQDASG